MLVLTREASYEGAGLWQEVSGNICIFTSSRLAVDQQQGLVAWDCHLDFMALTVTQWGRRTGDDDISYRHQNKLKTQNESVERSDSHFTSIQRFRYSHLAIHQCRDDSRLEQWRAELCPGERVQTALQSQTWDAGSAGRSGSVILKWWEQEVKEQQVMNFIHKQTKQNVDIRAGDDGSQVTFTQTN